MEGVGSNFSLEHSGSREQWSFSAGSNYASLPVNAPRGAVAATYQRDGFMRFDDNGKGSPNYYPNSFEGPRPEPAVAMPALSVAGLAARQPYRHPNDDFVQPRALYAQVMSDTDRAHLIGNIVSHLKNAQQRIQLRQTALFHKVHPDYGTRVAQGLGLDPTQVAALAELTQEQLVAETAAK